MHINDMIESKYLRQSDIGDEFVVVTIASLKKVNVARDDDEPDYQWTVKFEEYPKPMVLKPTNLKRLAKSLGDDSESWLGGKMELYVDHEVEFGGKIVGGLRLRGIAKKATKPQRQLSDDDANKALRDIDDDSVPF